MNRAVLFLGLCLTQWANAVGTVYLRSSFDPVRRTIQVEALSNSTEAFVVSELRFTNARLADAVAPVALRVAPFSDTKITVPAPGTLTAANVADWRLQATNEHIRTGPLALARPKERGVLPKGWELRGSELRIPVGTHRFTEDLVLDRELQLSIKPDTVFILAPGVSLFFRGQFNVRGLSIRSQDPERPWHGVVFSNYGQASTFEDVTVEGGHDGTVAGLPNTCALCIYGGTVNIVRLTVQRTRAEDGVNIKNGKVSMTRSTFRQTASDAFDCDFCELEVTHSTFHDIGGDGLDVSTTRAAVSDNTFAVAGDKAISVGEGSRATIERNRIRSAAIGVASKDTSHAVLRDNHFDDCATNIAAYRKKPLWIGGGTVELSGADRKLLKRQVDGLSRITELAH